MNWDYVAGFFDGEGCVSIALSSPHGEKHERHGYPTVQITFTNTDKVTLQELANFLHTHHINCGFYCRSREQVQKGSHGTKEQYNIRITSQDSKKIFVDAIKDRVISKVKNLKLAEEALFYIRTARQGKRNWTAEQKEEFTRKFVHTRKCSRNNSGVTAKNTINESSA